MNVPVSNLAQALLTGRTPEEAAAFARELSSLSTVFERASGVRRMFASPATSPAKREQLLTKAKIGEATRSVLEWLQQRQQLRMLPSLARAVERRVKQMGTLAHVTVTSVLPLTAAEKTSLQKTLAVRTGRQVRLSERVDPTIVGGLVVDLPGERIDASVRGRLRRLRAAALASSTIL